MRVLKTRRQDLTRVEFAPQGRGLLAVGRDEAVLWPDGLGDAKPAKYTNGRIWDAALAATGRHLIVSSSAGVWVAVLGTDTTFQVVGEEWRGHAIAASPTGPEFVLHGRRATMSGWRINPDGAAQLWDRAPAHTYSPVTFLPDGNRFIRTEFRGWTVEVPMVLMTHDTATGEVVGEVRAPEFAYSPWVVSPDGERLAIESGGSVDVYELADPSRLVARLPNSGLKMFTAVAFDPSRRFLAATSNDGTLKLYDTTTWDCVRTFNWDVGRLRCVAFSPDGLLAVAGSDTGRVVVCDVDV